MKKVFDIKSPSHPDSGMLVMRVSSRHLAFALTNESASRLDELGYYILQEPLDENGLMKIYQQEDVLRKTYSQARIAFDYPFSTLVPEEYASVFPDNNNFQLQFGIQGRMHGESDLLTSQRLQNHYSLPFAVWDWMQSHFSQAKCMHGYSADLCRLEPTDFEGAISLDFRADEFSLLASRAQQLLLAQTFPYENPADVLYYLLKVAGEFGLSQRDLRLSCSGLIEKDSSLYRELHQYFLHLRFRDAAWLLPETEEPLPAHYFTALYDLAKCG